MRAIPVFDHLRDLTRRRTMLTVAALLLAPTADVFAQTVLFFDDFSGPTLNATFQPSLPGGASLADGGGSCTYLGASDYSFESLEGASVLRMTSFLDKWQRRGWSTSTAFAATDFRYEARFNVLVQSPTTSIDSFIELWLVDPANTSRYSIAGPHGGSYGLNRQFRAGSRNGGQYSGSSVVSSYADNMWYRLLIESLPGENMRAALLTDDGTTELIGRTLAYSASAFTDGFQIGLGQATGAPNGAYPVDVAIDWIRLTTTAASDLTGDYNGNGAVDAADYVVWRDKSGQAGAGLAADGNGDGLVNQADYDLWRAHFGQSAGATADLPQSVVDAAIPEPRARVLLLSGLAAACCIHRSRRCKARDRWNTIEFGVVARQVHQSMILHDGDQQSIVGEQARLLAHLHRAANQLRLNCECLEPRLEDIIHGAAEACQLLQRRWLGLQSFDNLRGPAEGQRSFKGHQPVCHFAEDVSRGEPGDVSRFNAAHEIAAFPPQNRMRGEVIHEHIGVQEDACARWNRGQRHISSLGSNSGDSAKRSTVSASPVHCNIPYAARRGLTIGCTTTRTFSCSFSGRGVAGLRTPSSYVASMDSSIFGVAGGVHVDRTHFDSTSQLPSIQTPTFSKDLDHAANTGHTCRVDDLAITDLARESLLAGGNTDGGIDAADYVVWRDKSGQAGAGLAADGNGDGIVNAADYDLWRANFGQSASSRAAHEGVPEPSGFALAALALMAIALPRPRIEKRTSM